MGCRAGNEGSVDKSADGVGDRKGSCAEICGVLGESGGVCRESIEGLVEHVDFFCESVGIFVESDGRAENGGSL